MQSNAISLHSHAEMKISTCAKCCDMHRLCFHFELITMDQIRENNELQVSQSFR